MNISISSPNAVATSRFLSQIKTLPLSYPEHGGTKSIFPTGYDHDYNKTLLGKGEAIFQKAKIALSNWQMFPKPWTQIVPKKAPIQKGVEVGVFFHLFGLWWKNACRIVYTIDEEKRFGFAYGTLTAHVEQGEECFWVEIDDAGKVWYHIQAFSKPRFWLTRLGYPIARYYQRKFVRDSFREMQKVVG